MSSVVVNPELVAAVAAAVERLRRDGIEGWGLRVPAALEDLGDVLITGPAYGCTDETCAHVSHSPAAPTRKWVPRPSWTLVTLGNEDEGETRVTYYALIPDHDQVMYVALQESRPPYWSRLSILQADDVPEWALSALADA